TEAAVEEPQTLARAVAHPHRQIPHAPFAVGSAGGIRAAKSGELVHGQSSPTLACVGSTSLPRGQLWQPSFSSSITTGHQQNINPRVNYPARFFCSSRGAYPRTSDRPVK